MKASNIVLILFGFLFGLRALADESADSVSSSKMSGFAVGHESKAHESSQESEENSEPVQSLSTSLGTIVPQPSKRKWGVELYAEDYYTIANANRGVGQMYTDQFVGVTYKFKENLSGYIRQNFLSYIDNTTPGAPGYKGSSYMFDDTEFGIATNKLFTWQNGGSFNILHRIFIPTGVYSERGGEIGRLYEEVTASQPLNRYFEVGFSGDFRLKAATKNGYVDNFATHKGNRTAKIVPALYVTAKPNKLISSTIYAGTIDWIDRPYLASAGGHTSATYLDTSVSGQITKMVALTAGVENDMQTGNGQTHSPSLYRADETYYYMNLYATL
jgi:hypothetical protein